VQMSWALKTLHKAGLRELTLIADEDCAIQSKASLTNFSDLVTRIIFSFIYNQGQDEHT